MDDFFFTSSTRRRGIWKKLSNNFNFTCVCKSAKQSLIFLKTSLFSWEQIEPLVHSLDVPSLLCSHKDVSLSRFAAIFQLKFQFQDSVNFSSKQTHNRHNRCIPTTHTSTHTCYTTLQWHTCTHTWTRFTNRLTHHRLVCTEADFISIAFLKCLAYNRPTHQCIHAKSESNNNNNNTIKMHLLNHFRVIRCDFY